MNILWKSEPVMCGFSPMDEVCVYLCECVCFVHLDEVNIFNG